MRARAGRLSAANPLYLTALGVMNLVCDTEFRDAFPGHELAFAQLFRAAPFQRGDAEQAPAVPLKERLVALFKEAKDPAERTALASLVTRDLMTGISDEDRQRVLRLGRPRRRGVGGAPGLDSEHSRKGLERMWAMLEVSGRASPLLNVPVPLSVCAPSSSCDWMCEARVLNARTARY